MNKDEIIKVAKSLMFNVNDQVLDDFEVFFIEHLKELENLKDIETTNVLPMTMVNTSPITYMREDEVGEALSKEKLLSNAKNVSHGFVTLPRAVNDDQE